MLQANSLAFRATASHCAFAVQRIQALIPNGDPFGHKRPWFEALVRPYPDSGYSPAEFMDAIYRSRRCAASDLEVVERLTAWLVRQPEFTRLSINIHPDSLTDSDFVEEVMRHQSRLAAGGTQSAWSWSSSSGTRANQRLSITHSDCANQGS